jgi:hypothetical protein
MTRTEPQPVPLFLSDSLTADSTLRLSMRELFERLDKLSG